MSVTRDGNSADCRSQAMSLRTSQLVIGDFATVMLLNMTKVTTRELRVQTACADKEFEAFIRRCRAKWKYGIPKILDTLACAGRSLGGNQCSGQCSSPRRRQADHRRLDPRWVDSGRQGASAGPSYNGHGATGGYRHARSLQ